VTAISLEPELLRASSDLPEGNGRASLLFKIPSYLVLLRVTLAMPFVSPQTRWALTSPFHPYLWWGIPSPTHRRYVFCGAGVGSLRLGVTQHPCPWSPDFPPSM